MAAHGRVGDPLEVFHQAAVLLVDAQAAGFLLLEGLHGGDDR